MIKPYANFISDKVLLGHKPHFDHIEAFVQATRVMERSFLFASNEITPIPHGILVYTYTTPQHVQVELQLVQDFSPKARVTPQTITSRELEDFLRGRER